MISCKSRNSQSEEAIQQVVPSPFHFLSLPLAHSHSPFQTPPFPHFSSLEEGSRVITAEMCLKYCCIIVVFVFHC